MTDQDILRRDVESIFLRLDELDKRVECLILASPAQRIGVYDYDSLVACLRTNYLLVFPGETWVDPQNMIQLMVATIQNFRRQIIAEFEEGDNA